MKRGKKLLVPASMVCIVGTVLFFLLLSFTPVKQKFYEHLLFSSMEELGYKVVLVQKQGNTNVLNLEIPKGESLDAKGLQELLAKAQKLAAAKHASIVKKGSIAGLALGSLLLGLSMGLDVFIRFRAARKRPKEKFVRKRAVATAPRQKPSLSPLSTSSVTVTIAPKPLPSWEKLISTIQEKLLGVEDLLMQTEFRAELKYLLQEGRKRVSKAKHLLERVTEVAKNRGSPPLNPSHTNSLPASSAIVSPNGEGRTLNDLLSIDDLLLEGVDPVSIKTILLGFLQPGSAVPFFEGSYTSMEDLRRSVKLPVRELREGLQYLERIGLLIRRHRKVRGKVLLSLHTKAKTSPAREIAQLVIQVRRSIEQEGILVRRGP